MKDEEKYQNLGGRGNLLSSTSGREEGLRHDNWNRHHSQLKCEVLINPESKGIREESMKKQTPLEGIKEGKKTREEDQGPKAVGSKCTIPSFQDKHQGTCGLGQHLTRKSRREAEELRRKRPERSSRRGYGISN